MATKLLRMLVKGGESGVALQVGNHQQGAKEGAGRGGSGGAALICIGGGGVGRGGGGGGGG